tara:strand:+ start:1088 stop:1648 length:561 start_codon:yes stop_codon:yes gene_type:complete
MEINNKKLHKNIDIDINRILTIDTSRILNVGLYIALFYLTISTNFIGELYNKELISILHNNYYIKHLLGYITLLTFIIMTDTKTHNFMEDLKLSVITYILFVASTKNNPHYFLLSIICIFSAFMIERISNTYNMNIETKKKLKIMYNYLGILGVIIIIYGFGKEYIKKTKLYKENFSIIKFFFGKN